MGPLREQVEARHPSLINTDFMFGALVAIRHDIKGIGVTTLYFTTSSVYRLISGCLFLKKPFGF